MRRQGLFRSSRPVGGAESVGPGWAVGGSVAQLPVLSRSALPVVAFVPYAGAVPDGGRHGFEAAVAVAAPIV